MLYQWLLKNELHIGARICRHRYRTRNEQETGRNARYMVNYGCIFI